MHTCSNTVQSEIGTDKDGQGSEPLVRQQLPFPISRSNHTPRVVTQKHIIHTCASCQDYLRSTKRSALHPETSLPREAKRTVPLPPCRAQAAGE